MIGGAQIPPGLRGEIGRKSPWEGSGEAREERPLLPGALGEWTETWARNLLSAKAGCERFEVTCEESAPCISARICSSRLACNFGACGHHSEVRLVTLS